MCSSPLPGHAPSSRRCPCSRAFDPQQGQESRGHMPGRGPAGWTVQGKPDPRGASSHSLSAAPTGSPVTAGSLLSHTRRASEKPGPRETGTRGQKGDRREMTHTGPSRRLPGLARLRLPSPPIYASVSCAGSRETLRSRERVACAPGAPRTAGTPNRCCRERPHSAAPMAPRVEPTHLQRPRRPSSRGTLSGWRSKSLCSERFTPRPTATPPKDAGPAGKV